MTRQFSPGQWRRPCSQATSLCGFGSGLVWARRIAVEQRQWISEEEFTDILSLGQFMPGPNVVGIAVCIGASYAG